MNFTGVQYQAITTIQFISVVENFELMFEYVCSYTPNSIKFITFICYI